MESSADKYAIRFHKSVVHMLLYVPYFLLKDLL